jgi:hypothetical protein
MIYVKRGLEKDLAMKVPEQLSAHDRLGAHMRDELGIDQAAFARPLRAAWIASNCPSSRGEIGSDRPFSSSSTSWIQYWKPGFALSNPASGKAPIAQAVLIGHNNVMQTSISPRVNRRPGAPTTHLKRTPHEAKPSRDEVAKEAYFIYLNQGCPQGQDMNHWLEAEAHVLKARNTARESVLM